MCRSPPPCQETWAFTGARIHTAAGKPIENGKDTDLALFDGNPFEYTSHVEKVLVNGQVVHSRR